MVSPSKLPRHMQTPPQFAWDWFSPLRSVEVVPGKITNFTFMGNELIAFRDEAGKVVVLDAHCPHFGAHYGHGGTVDNGCVRCPFHGLHFDNRGQCVKGDFVAKASTLKHVKTIPWTVRETAGSIFLWHGRDRQNPSREFPIPDDYFDGWTEPKTNAGRVLAPTNLFFPMENIVDIQHFYAVHHWELNRIIQKPRADPDGQFRALLDMTWTLLAQSKNPTLKRLGKLVSSNYTFDISIYGPGIAFSEVELYSHNGLRIRNIILVTPTNETDCRIRVISSIKKGIDTPFNRALRTLVGKGIEELLTPLILAVATKDFDGDEMIWTHRAFLSRPNVLAEDGPVIEFRKWCLQFWPDEAPAVEVAAARRRATSGNGQVKTAAAPA